MSLKNLTDQFVSKATSEGAARADYYDMTHKGLALRVTDKGNKTWTFKYTSPRDGKSARITLGTYPALSLKDARAKTLVARANVESQTDPRDVSAATQSPKTIAELIEDRLAMEVRGKMRSAAEVERRFAKYVTPLVGKVPVKNFQIDPHYNAIIDPLLKRGKARQAGVVFQDMRALFNFAIQRGVIEYSRIAKVKRPDEAVVRERYLTCSEIATVWAALPAVLAGTENVQGVVKLLLATGQRLSEVAGMSRAEVNLSKRVWTIPEGRVKNGYEHAVPLSDLAVQIIRDAMNKTNSAFLFPNKSSEGPLVHEVIDSTLRRAQAARPKQSLGKFGIPVWRPHDLRRTVATQMSRKENALAVPSIVISHVLNHRTSTKGTITQAIYDQNDYLDEKREALEKWGAFLARLVGEDQQLQDAAE